MVPWQQSAYAHLQSATLWDGCGLARGSLFQADVSKVWASTKSKVQGRVFRCTNKRCGWTWHRDGVGAYNIRQKYRGEFGIPHVVADMAPATGIRFAPHTRVARSQGEKVSAWVTVQKPLRL